MMIFRGDISKGIQMRQKREKERRSLPLRIFSSFIKVSSTELNLRLNASSSP